MESLNQFFRENRIAVWNFVCGCRKCNFKIIHSTPSEVLALATKFGFDTKAMSGDDLYKKLPHAVIQSYLSPKQQGE